MRNSMQARTIDTVRTQISVARANSSHTEEIKNPHVELAQLELQLDCLRRESDYLGLQTIGRKAVVLPNRISSPGETDLRHLLALWDQLETKIVTSNIELLEVRQKIIQDSKLSSLSLKDVEKAVEQAIEALDTTETLQDSDTNVVATAQAEELSANLVLAEKLSDLLSEGKKIAQTLRSVNGSEGVGFDELKTNYGSFAKKSKSQRQKIVAMALQAIFQKRAIIQDLINLRVDAISTPNESPAQASIHPMFVHALATLHLIDSYLSGEFDSIENNPKSSNILIRVVRALWGYKLTFGEDASIKIGEIALLLFSVMSGIFTAFFASKLIGQFVLPRFGIHAGVAIAWRLIIRNLLALLFVFIAFQLFGVPLAAFAFIGGAAALAVGFGSKDIANNFMSGLIILTEQPVRVNDVIMHDSKQCLVTYIGLRSTRLLNLENHELVVPNSVLIDRLVTNLTLSDNRVRLVLPLEVERTEDATLSIARMSDSLVRVDGVFSENMPLVLLKSVDTYYLNFDIHITIEFESLSEIPVIQSRVLTAMAGLFPTKTDTSESSSGSALDSSKLSGTDSVGGKRSAKQIEHEITRLKGELKSLV